MHLDARVAALCASPAGGAFLLVLEQNGFTPAAATEPALAIHAAALALSYLDPHSDSHDVVASAALAEGPRLAELARAVLAEPAARWWFAPLDPAAQMLVLDPGEPLKLHGDRRQRGAEAQAVGRMLALNAYTSTALGRDCSILAAMEHHAGDYYPTPPIRRVLIRASKSARVYEIDGPTAWHALASAYPATDDDGLLAPDFDLAANDWDAVHITLGGVLTATDVRVESAAGVSELRHWVAEETVWFRWQFEEIARLPELMAPPPSPVSHETIPTLREAAMPFSQIWWGRSADKRP